MTSEQAFALIMPKISDSTVEDLGGVRDDIYHEVLTGLGVEDGYGFPSKFLLRQLIEVYKMGTRDGQNQAFDILNQGASSR